MRARFVAAMLFLCTFMSLEKGRLGEIEAAFTLLVWGSLAFAWQGFQSSRSGWWWLSGLALGAAVLVKGPPAWVFFYGALLCYCWQQGCMKWFLSREHFIVFSYSVFLFSIWLFAALERAGWSALVETGSREMIGRGGYGIAAFIKEHSSLIGNGFMGLFPGSFFWIAYFWRDRWRGKSEDIRVQVFLLCIVLSGWFFFLYYPGARARYLYPLAPATALLGAIVWERALVQPSLHKWISGFYGLVSVMGVVGIGTLFGLTAVIPERIPLFVLLGLLSLILVIAMRIMWRKRFTYSSIFLQLALIWVLSLTGVLAQNSKTLFSLPVRQSAVLLSTFVPDGEPVYSLSWSEFNLFYYVQNPVRYINSLDSLERDGRSYWVAFRYLDDVRPFDRWEIRDFVVVPLSARDCVYAVKIQ